MLKITALVNAPTGCSQGVKEDIAMFCERFGDTRVISIEEEYPEQMSFSKERKATGEGSSIASKTKRYHNA